MAQFKHGESRTSEGRTYRNMLMRCKVNAKPRVRMYYADRGIKVCDHWLGDLGVVRFVADMGRKPSPQHTLERRDNDKGYSPDNCYWAIPAEQGRNRRSNHLLTFEGRTMCLADWAKTRGWNPITLWTRVKTYKWPIARALTQPIQTKRLHKRTGARRESASN